MLLEKKHKIEHVCSKPNFGRPALENPYVIKAKGEATLLATNQYVAAYVPVVLMNTDTEGYVQLNHIKEARKNKEHARVTDDRPGGGQTFPLKALLKVQPDRERADNPMRVGIDAKHLYNLARALGCEQLELQFQAEDDGGLAATRPIEVFPIGEAAVGNDACGVIMPIRVRR